ncbi:hypothetical protein M0805_008580 [Coniferiporia weirii]|nr:hypothetical protein M0805_008580 [Coniferiporia weirii]
MSAEAGSSRGPSLTSSSFDAYSADIQGAALGATKLSAALPADISFHRSLDSDFAQAIDSCSERALKLTNRLLGLSATHSSKDSRSKGKRKLEDQEDVLDSFQSLVVDALDQFFEHADMNLDEFLGRPKPATVSIKPVPQASTSVRHGRLDPALMHASHLPKPQLKFRRKVDNANDSKWSQSLKHKYNAQVPLGYALHDAMNDENDEEDYRSASRRPHPYRYEIEHTTYPQRMFEHKDTVPWKSLETIPFTWVDTKVGLDSLLDKLRRAEEIAVDLEHHSYRSFSGFLCLMQISTREEDFIVDTLALREELEDLNEVFTDPKVVKVFHGAESDIVWLQQDFNLYIVNLFDTYHASKLLDFPKHGLAALLEMYCDFIPDKRYQLADWRIRPLPTEMLNYARSDTHFLLYIYDSLRNALLDRAAGQPDLVRTTLERSQETALRTYEREVYDITTGAGPGGWDTLATKWGRMLSGKPPAVFRAVHAWRDSLARAEDESTRYVLPNHYLFQLAERPPADVAALLRVFRPVPPLVRAKAGSLLDTILAAVKEQTSQGVSNEDEKIEVLEQESLRDVVKTSGGPIVMNLDSMLGEKASPNNEKASHDLWATQAPRVSIAATSSTLLGSQATKTKQQTRLCSSRSSLFPTGWKTSSEHVRKMERYSEVVARIHGALVVAPSLLKTLGLSASLNGKDSISTWPLGVAQSSAAAESEPIEIPFIPAAQRQPQVPTSTEVTDSIVVVGQARQKKRKRSKQQVDAGSDDAEGGEEGGNESKKAKGKSKPTVDVDSNVGLEMPEIEPFDYASAPNFLDGPVMDSSSVRKPARTKAKNSKGRAFEYGNFPAPPRAFNEVKGANKSHTFRR